MRTWTKNKCTCTISEIKNKQVCTVGAQASRLMANGSRVKKN